VFALRAFAAAALAWAATSAHPACLSIAAVPDGHVLATLAMPDAGQAFDITYVHSVTRRAIVESYRLDAGALLETSIVFDQHGPGLPTAPDAGQTWTERDGRFVVTLARRFETIRVRVHRDQQWRLVVAGKAIDLTQWGNRAVDLRAVACREGTS